MEKMLEKAKYKNSCELMLIQLVEFIPEYLSRRNFSAEYQEHCSRLVKVLEKAIDAHIIPTIGHIERLKQLVLQAKKEGIALEIKEFHKLLR
jgi:hypothetical protein